MHTFLRTYIRTYVRIYHTAKYVCVYDSQISGNTVVSFPVRHSTHDQRSKLNKEIVGTSTFITLLENMSWKFPVMHTDIYVHDRNVTLYGQTRQTYLTYHGKFNSEIRLEESVMCTCFRGQCVVGMYVYWMGLNQCVVCMHIDGSNVSYVTTYTHIQHTYYVHTYTYYIHTYIVTYTKDNNGTTG